ncbi:cilia- and flagella-associated protein 91-like isoform X1 [Acanthaster planci]|uniref:Cilia- and flagella-associated protein 91 n=1 Tax=Acanthaster planci TaxID=133434 RepID=A0A8B7ZE73_ACAPL|nr:cilia- and flagella-associated protein 91-like isoform X1 [Acanthaster planci]
MSMGQTMRAPRVQQTRTHDYLYDNVHTLSSERDHARHMFKAHTSLDRVKKVPLYKTMFSALRHHPRFQMRLDTTDPVPRFISRQWRGYSTQAREALVRYKTFNYAPDVKLPPVQFAQHDVGGQDRYKFFRRPIIPFLQQVPPEVVLHTSKLDPFGQQEQVMMERSPTPLTRTVDVQTDYRESETQTDPYTPEYVVRPGSQPELLTLATLSYGHGLPAGLAEVEMIERARAKRAWEATLPSLNDVSQLEKRKRMMDEMERKEWALREQEIEKLQEARLELLTKILREREENHVELNSKRLDKLWSKKQKERERKVNWIRKEHIKAIRKLTLKRSQVEGNLERRDITQEYAKYESEVYGPRTRHGVFLDKGSEQYVVKSKYLDTYQGLLELEHTLPDFVTQPRVVAPRPKSQGKTGFIKRAQRRQNELDEIYKGIKDIKTKGKEAPKPLRFLQKIEKPIPRPPTPSVEVPDLVEEERELAIIFLQQVIRGRAIQNMMFEGKEKRQELINELRSTHALQSAEQQMKKQEKQSTLNLQRQRRLHQHKESFVDEAMSQLEGESAGDMLDFLSKELIRLQEERRIHAYAMLAERQRRIREAEESGRRQVEERRRREEDEIFKQVVKVHQNSVDTYLEDIILLSMDNTADKQAREEIQMMAQRINEVAYDMEDRKTELESEEIVAELVSTFLLPEVQKITVREKVKLQQRKHLLAAHKIVHKETEEVITQHPTPAKAQGSQGRTVGSPKPGSAKEGRSTPTKTSRPGSAAKSTRRTPTPTAGAPATPVTSRPPSGTPRGSPAPEGTGSPKPRPGSGRRRSDGSAAGSRSASPKVSKQSPRSSPVPQQSTSSPQPVTETPRSPIQEQPSVQTPPPPVDKDTTQDTVAAVEPSSIQAPDADDAPPPDASPPLVPGGVEQTEPSPDQTEPGPEKEQDPIAKEPTEKTEIGETTPKEDAPEQDTSAAEAPADPTPALAQDLLPPQSSQSSQLGDPQAPTSGQSNKSGKQTADSATQEDASITITTGQVQDEKKPPGEDTS